MGMRYVSNTTNFPIFNEQVFRYYIIGEKRKEKRRKKNFRYWLCTSVLECFWSTGSSTMLMQPLFSFTFVGAKSRSASDADLKSSVAGVTRKVPLPTISGIKRETPPGSSGSGLAAKKPKLGSQTFTPLGRPIETDRKSSPTFQQFQYDEIAKEGRHHHSSITFSNYNKISNIECMQYNMSLKKLIKET